MNNMIYKLYLYMHKWHRIISVHKISIEEGNKTMKKFNKLFAILVIALVAAVSVATLAACGGIEFRIGFMVDGQEIHHVNTSGNEVIRMPQDPTRIGYTFGGWFWDQGTWFIPFTANSLLDAPLSSNMAVHARFIRNNQGGQPDNSQPGATINLQTVADAFSLLNGFWVTGPTTLLSTTSLSAVNVFTGEEFWIFQYSNQLEADFGWESAGIIIDVSSANMTRHRDGLFVWYGTFDAITTFNQVRAGTFVPPIQVPTLPFTLRNILVQVTGQPNTFIDPTNMTVSQALVYQSLIDLYGDVIYKGQGAMDFTGLQLGAFNQARFNQVGQNIVFDNVTLNAFFTFVTFNDGVLSLSFVQAGVGSFIFQYFGEDVLMPQYSLILNPNGGEVDESYHSVRLHELIGTLPAATRYGYTFLGWNCIRFGNLTGSERFSHRENLIISARWQANAYRLDFNFQGATGGTSPTFRNVTFGFSVGTLPNPTRANFNFNGWWTEPNGQGNRILNTTIWTTSGGAILFAHFIPHDRTIHLNYQGATGGNTIPSLIVPFGTAVGTLPTPTRTGFNFNGWFTQAGSGGVIVTAETIHNAAGTITLFARWTTTLTFNYQGATGGNALTSIHVAYNANIGTLPSPTLVGHSFAGWWTQAISGGTQITATTNFSFNGPTTLFARWTANTYQVTLNTSGGEQAAPRVSFSLNGGTGIVPETQTVTATQGLVYPPVPTRDNFAFAGWHTNPQGAGAAFNFATTVTASITLYARWIAVANERVLLTPNVTSSTQVAVNRYRSIFVYVPLVSGNVTFETFGAGNDFLGRILTVGGTVVRAQRNGGGSGWNYRDTAFLSAGNMYMVEIWRCTCKPTIGTTNFTIRASQDNPIPPGGGRSVARDQVITVTFNQPMPSITTPARLGHTFAGFYTLASGQGVRFINADGSSARNWTTAGNGELFANWTVNDYTITFDAQGGTTPVASRVVTFNTAVGELPVPYKAGNNFGGWFSGIGASGVEFTASTVFANDGNMTLFASWQTTITFDYQGATGSNAITTMQATFNALVPNLPNPTRTGFTFVGWYTQSYGLGTLITTSTVFSFDASITLFARWNTTINFNYQGATGGSRPDAIAVTYGRNVDVISALPVPVRTGFTFDGWFKEVGGQGQQIINNQIFDHSGIISVFAKWTTTITFNYQGATSSNSVATMTAIYNLALGTLPAPIKANNAFGGWFTVIGGGGNQFTADTVFTNNGALTLFARWDTTITFYYGGADSDNTIVNLDVIYRQAISALPRPFRTGYSFEGWFLGDTEWLAGRNFTESEAITLTARWVVGTDKAYFTFTTTGGAVTITGLSNRSPNIENIVVPEIIDHLPVTSITANAFLNRNLVNVVVPNSVQSIGNAAFRGNPVVNITLPFVGFSRTTAVANSQPFGFIFGFLTRNSGGVDTITSSGWPVMLYAPSAGRTHEYFVPDTIRSVTITDGPIGNNAFRNLTFVTEITIPVGTTHIGIEAFRNNHALLTVNNLESARYFATGAFRSAHRLESVNDIAEVRYVASFAFWETWRLGSVNLAVGITSIGNNAFAGAGTSSFTMIYLPSTLITIGEGAFRNSSITSIVVPNSVQTIGRDAFRETYMVSMTLPFVGFSRTATAANAQPFGFIFGFITRNSGGTATITSNGWPVMLYAPSAGRTHEYFVPNTLRYITITDGPIGNNAFRNLTFVTEITIPVGTTHIGVEAFRNNTALVTINNLSGARYFSYGAFWGATSLESVMSISEIQAVGARAFRDALQLTSVNFGNSITLIDAEAFRNTRLSAIEVPNSVITIGEGAFRHITTLTTAVVADSVQTIGQDTFRYSPLVSISVPFVGFSRTATAAHAIPFGFIFGMSSITAGETVISSSGWPVMHHAPGSSASFRYYVPNTLRYITITDGPIGNNAFRNLTFVTEINFPQSITSIGIDAFRNTSSLHELVIPDSVVNMPRGVLQGSGVRHLTVPLLGSYNQNNHSYLRFLFGGASFSNVTAATIPPRLRYVTVSGSAATVSDFAFFGFAGVYSVTFINEITHIGRQAFEGMSAFRILHLLSEIPPTIGENAFAGVGGRLVITVPLAALAEYLGDDVWINIDRPIIANNAAAIIFDSMGGSLVNTIIGDAAKTVAEPINPMWQNRIFAGWYLDEALTQPFCWDTVLDSTIILYARWTLVVVGNHETIGMVIEQAGDYFMFRFYPPTSGRFRVIITNQTSSVHVTFAGLTGNSAVSGFQVAPTADLVEGMPVTIVVRMNTTTGVNAVGSFTMQVANF